MSNKAEQFALSEHKQITNAPEVSSELIRELARMCGLIPPHTTAEWVSTLVRFVRVVLDNNSVQEAFVRANAGLLSVSSALITDERIDVIWSDTRETLPQPVSETFTMRAFARALLAASPADQGEDARDAARYRFIKESRLILSGGTTKFGWAISPFGDQCDRYIDAAMSASKEGA